MRADLFLGPTRTKRELRLSVLGGIVGGILAAGFGLAYRENGIQTDTFWRMYPPPVEPFAFLPLSAGVAAGLRFTINVVRPRRMTLRRVLGLSLAICALTAIWFAGLALIGSAVTSGWRTQPELLWNLAWATVMTPPMAVAVMVYPGLMLAPFFFPTVAIFVVILRSIHRLSSKLPVVAVVSLIAIVGCASPAPKFEDHLRTAEVVELPAAFYYGVVWIEPDVLAFAVLAPDDSTRIDLVSRSAEPLRSFEPQVREECARRTFLGLTRLPTGEVGAADVCTLAFADPPQTAELIALDPASLRRRSLGATSMIPTWLTWRSDMEAAVYSVGDDLCAVLYERTELDHPLEQTITSQGATFEVGVDLTTDADGCPDVGRASYPAFGGDDWLAFMASANAGRDGQDLIDLPWALFIRKGGEAPTQIADGIRWPRGLSWVRDDYLIFSGAFGDARGIWSIAADGNGLIKIADQEASWLAVSPDGRDLVAIRESLVGDDWETHAVSYHLGDM